MASKTKERGELKPLNKLLPIIEQVTMKSAKDLDLLEEVFSLIKLHLKIKKSAGIHNAEDDSVSITDDVCSFLREYLEINNQKRRSYSPRQSVH